MTETLIAVIVFGVLFAISVVGFLNSMRAGDQQDRMRSLEHPGSTRASAAPLPEPGTARTDRLIER